MLNYYSSPTLAGTIVCGNTPDQVYSSWTDNGGNCIAELCDDTNDDGYVNVTDLPAIVEAWGACP